MPKIIIVNCCADCKWVSADTYGPATCCCRKLNAPILRELVNSFVLEDCPLPEARE
jgi:hypothetical protein